MAVPSQRERGHARLGPGGTLVVREGDRALVLVRLRARDEAHLVGVGIAEQQDLAHEQILLDRAPLREQGLRLGPLLISLRVKCQVCPVIDRGVVVEQRNPLLNVRTALLHLDQRRHAHDHVVLPLEELLVLRKVLPGVLRNRCRPAFEAIAPARPSRDLNHLLRTVQKVQRVDCRCLVRSRPTGWHVHALRPAHTAIRRVTHQRRPEAVPLAVHRQNRLVVGQQNRVWLTKILHALVVHHYHVVRGQVVLRDGVLFHLD